MDDKRNKLPKAFTDSEVGTLIEHFDSKLDLVIDEHKALDKKIDANQEEFREFRKEVNYKFEVAFDELRVI